MKDVGEWPVESHLINTHKHSVMRQCPMRAGWLWVNISLHTFHQSIHYMSSEINCSIYGETKT